MDSNSPESDPVWAIVPVKYLSEAKQRLAQSLSAGERRRLCEAMLQDVLTTLGASPQIDGITVVSEDSQVAALAADFDCELLSESELDAHGLNEAVTAAVRRLAVRGIGDVLVVHGDLPLFSDPDLSALLKMHANAGEPAVTIAADRHRSGSNCIIASPASLLKYQFGESSLGKHITGARDAGMKSTVLILPGAGLDIDTPDDLAALRNAIDPCSDSHTARCLRTFVTGSPEILAANRVPQGLGTPVALPRSE